MAQIEEVIAAVDDWKGKAAQAEQLSGGLTNTNYRVIVDDVPFFVRIAGESTELLSIDRQNEFHNASAAAQAGVGPRILHYFPALKAIVIEFLYGRTMSNAALGEPGMPARIAGVLKQLHAGPRFLRDFDMFRLTEIYLQTCQERAIPMPAGYLERMPTVKRIEQSMLRSPVPTVPCHNDLLAENYMEVGESLKLIDFEYSGNNDPCFELANTAQELQYGDVQLAELCAGYFGAAMPGKIARMKLNMIMSDVGWGLWAAIQARISKIDFDFWGWATERWGRATTKMDSPEFEGWLKRCD